MSDAPRARRPGAARLRGVVASLTLLALGGCSDAVDIPSHDVPSADASTCRELLDGLPETLAGEERRPVDPDGALGAAWGDPALVLECGTAMPGSFDDFSQCSVADGVQWYVPDAEARDPSGDITIHSLGYEPIISVLVPAAYRSRSDTVLADLVPVVEDHLELVQPCV